MNKTYCYSLLYIFLFLSACDKKEVEPVVPRDCLLKSLTDVVQSITFEYDNQQRVISSRSTPVEPYNFGESIVEYKYDKHQIKRVNQYYVSLGEYELHRYLLPKYDSRNNIIQVSRYELLGLPESKFQLTRDIKCEYNSSNRIIKQTIISHNGTNFYTIINTYEYDHQGNLIKRIDGVNTDRPKETKFIKYDDKFNPYKATNIFELFCVVYEVESQYNPLLIESPGESTTYEYEYNEKGFPIKASMTNVYAGVTSKNTTVFVYECN